jgi:hypothetical protein
MRELLAGLVPGCLRERSHVLSRAEGIPHAVETVRMLLAEGKLERRTRSTDRSATHLSFRATVAARADRGPPSMP